MGYTTYFNGQFDLDKPLTLSQAAYLAKFAETRRMVRDPEKALTLPDPIREAVGLGIGRQGGYFVGGSGDFGQDRDISILDYNNPPADQPSLWCQWVPDASGISIVQDEGEKFYGYVEWIEYLIEHFLGPWGYVLNGSVSWEGEDSDDRGIIYIKDNVVEAVPDDISNRGPSWGITP